MVCTGITQGDATGDQRSRRCIRLIGAYRRSGSIARELNAAGADSYTQNFIVSQTPLPAALPLFATGIAALGLLGWRRKRKAQAGA